MFVSPDRTLVCPESMPARSDRIRAFLRRGRCAVVGERASLAHPNTGYRVRVALLPGTDPAAVAARFNGSINRRDVDGLAKLMSDDHRFIDSEANTVSGKQTCLDAWRGFFDLFPDYRNVFTSLTATDDVVTIVGYSECAEPSLAGPAI